MNLLQKVLKDYKTSFRGDSKANGPYSFRGDNKVNGPYSFRGDNKVNGPYSFRGDTKVKGPYSFRGNQAVRPTEPISQIFLSKEKPAKFVNVNLNIYKK